MFIFVNMLSNFSRWRKLWRCLNSARKWSPSLAGCARPMERAATRSFPARPTPSSTGPSWSAKWKTERGSALWWSSTTASFRSRASRRTLFTKRCTKSGKSSRRSSSGALATLRSRAWHHHRRGIGITTMFFPTIQRRIFNFRPKPRHQTCIHGRGFKMAAWMWSKGRRSWTAATSIRWNELISLQNFGDLSQFWRFWCYGQYQILDFGVLICIRSCWDRFLRKTEKWYRCKIESYGDPPWEILILVNFWSNFVILGLRISHFGF